MTAGRGQLSVFLGQGDGTFAPAVDVLLVEDDAASSIALGDVNGDGVLDVVTSDTGPTLTSVLLGNGDGTLAAPVDFASSAAPVALGDLDGDGKADVVGLNAMSVQVLKTPAR